MCETEKFYVLILGEVTTEDRNKCPNQGREGF